MMRIAAVVACGLMSGSAVMQAQRVVTGVVRDSATGESLSGALVDLRSAAFQRAARSNQRGEFRMTEIPGGDYRVIVRRLGYAELQRDVRTMDRDTSLVFALSSVRRELDTVKVVASVNGIRGVVGTAHALQPVANATVQVVGLRRSTLTDSVGRYFVEVKKGGTYLMRIARTGYLHQLVSIEVPMDGSVETSTLLDSTDRREHMGTQTLWDDFDKRLVWRGPRSALVSAAELEELDGMSLTNALNKSRSGFRRGMMVGTGTCVFVNGTPRPGFTVDSIDPDRVEAVELYGSNGDGTGTLRAAWPSRMPCGAQQQAGPYGAAGLPLGTATWAVVWLKP